MNKEIEQIKKQLDQIEKTVYRIESDTIKLHKKLEHRNNPIYSYNIIIL